VTASQALTTISVKPTQFETKIETYAASPFGCNQDSTYNCRQIEGAGLNLDPANCAAVGALNRRSQGDRSRSRKLLATYDDLLNCLLGSVE
jgi:hypothetical protein